MKNIKQVKTVVFLLVVNTIIAIGFFSILTLKVSAAGGCPTSGPYGICIPIPPTGIINTQELPQFTSAQVAGAGAVMAVGATLFTNGKLIQKFLSRKRKVSVL